eukprot:7551521-Pyramimonas_sp.AAC.1
MVALINIQVNCDTVDGPSPDLCAPRSGGQERAADLPGAKLNMKPEPTTCFRTILPTLAACTN